MTETTIVAFDDLDVRLRVLVDGYADQHLLGDLDDRVVMCCQTRSTPSGFLSAAVLTPALIVIVLVRPDGESVRLGARLAGADLRAADGGVWVHAQWFGADPSSYLLPLEEGSVFLDVLRTRITAARHA
ncbi:hypothetical protein FDA94_18005 [Herbidospora galbida]|uniref:Uncharacterized protein n=1 Tax=Herbidospora galbida TaxID=2575442 RepID=A0A4V5UZ73_9ACTN|nr:hypothetical protein [Herbidospora galbida]TKK87393.1 hypothetical protein FDA94_18005 [Herbidospora galbida]